MCAVAPLWRCGKDGRGCGRERTHMREKQGACLSATFPPQDGGTPLHLAASKGRAAIVEKLLAAKANTEAKIRVRG